MASTIEVTRITVLPEGAFPEDPEGPPPVSPVRIEFGGFTETVDADNPGIPYKTQFSKSINYDDVPVGTAKNALDSFLADFAGADDLIAVLFPVVT